MIRAASYRHALTDTQWTKLQPVVPHRPAGRKQAKGIQWRDRPKRFGICKHRPLTEPTLAHTGCVGGSGDSTDRFGTLGEVLRPKSTRSSMRELWMSH